jgi:hypothetical protein
MSGKSAKKVRKQQRQEERLPENLVSVETLREWTAREIPSLLEPDPWTPEMQRILSDLYRSQHRGEKWLCPHECGHTVERFGQQCAKCLTHQEELGPVDWDSVGLAVSV